MSTTKTKNKPMRRCIGCMESKPKNNLIRIAYYEGELSVDPTGKAKGRGVYLCKSGDHPDKDCLQKAIKRKAFQRSLKAEFSEDELNKIMEELTANE